MKCKVILIISILALIVVLCSCGKKEEEIDPHEGMVYLYDGYDWIWYKPLDNVKTNALHKEDFKYENNKPIYLGSDYDVLEGIDVSEHQLDIDWDMVAKQNYDFCYIRLGRRGYTQGGIFSDEKFAYNMVGAKRAGLDLGVYFFSQATTVSEAIEEAQYVLDIVKDYSISLPIAYDWERIDEIDSRTANIDMDTITDCTIAFCETIKNAGYEPIVYYNRTSGYYRFDLSRLTDYKVWFSLPCTPPDVTFPSFYYHIDMWQYSATSIIPGIEVETDVNYWFIPKAESSPS